MWEADHSKSIWNEAITEYPRMENDREREREMFFLFYNILFIILSLSLSLSLSLELFFIDIPLEQALMKIDWYNFSWTLVEI